jgi:sigma-E factor negative regulatory protein RseC
MIDHDGIIEHIKGDVAHVKINSVSACAACHAKGVCSAADQEEKFLDIPLEGKQYNAGETVKVMVARNLGFKAVALGYVYPFMILMAVLITLTVAGLDELKAGLFALLSLPFYYLGLYLARRKIESTFTFSIQKTQTVQ